MSNGSVSRLVALLLTLALPAAAAPEDALIRLARETVRAQVLGTPAPKPDGQSPARPVFVTIERGGKVIGCRGSLESRSRSLEAEVILAAQSACAHDPRYRPLTPKDLDGFLVTVTVVRQLLPIADAAALTPADGLVLKAGSRTGVVLPWEGKDPEVRLGWAYRKAGVPPGTAVRLYRLAAERYRG